MKMITLKIGALLIFFVAMPAIAKPIVKHTLGSGPNVYRVEIRNLDRFKVLETGDTDGTGELHELNVQLKSYNPDYNTQYDGFNQKTPFFFNTRSNTGAGSGNLEVRVGDHVKLSGHRPPSGTTQSWVHAYSTAEDARDTRPYSNGRIELEVHALELDCTGQRVCRRNSQGNVTVSFKIPEFSSPPPTVCGRTNTFRLEPLDDGLHIRGITGTTVRSYTPGVQVLDPFWLLLKHKKGGPRLMPFNADICIASTVAPRNANLKKNIDRTKVPVSKEQRTKIIKKAFQ